MKVKYIILAIVAPGVFILDQFTKLLILNYVDLGSRIPVIQNFFDIVHFRNTGAAFGMFAQVSDSIRVPFFYIVAAIAAVFLVFYFRSLRADERVMPIALSLVLGGMFGNIADRIRLGSVVDFLSFHIGNKVADFSVLGKNFNFELEWPAFNVADSAITVAMFLLIITAFRKREF